jgi:hypothetical protein
MGTVAILDTSSLTVTGATNSYTQQGNFGITQVDGSLTAGQININAGLLDGSGTVNGPITISSRGFLLPGDYGPGTLTVKGDVTLNSGAQFLDVFNGNTNAGIDYGQLASTGTVNLNGSTLNVALLYQPNGTPTPLTIIKANTVAGTFAGLPDGTKFTLGGSTATFTISYKTNQVVLTDPLPQQAAPAPSASIAPPRPLTTPQDAFLFQEAFALWSTAEGGMMPRQGQIGELVQPFPGARAPVTILPGGAAAHRSWLAGGNGGNDEDSEQAPADPFDLLATSLAAEVRETPSRADIDAAFILK